MGLFSRPKVKGLKKLTQDYTEAMYFITETDILKEYVRAIVEQDLLDSYNESQQIQHSIRKQLTEADPAFQQQLDAIDDDIFNEVKAMYDKEYGEMPEPDVDYIEKMSAEHPDVINEIIVYGVASLGLLSKAKDSEESGDAESYDKLTYLSDKAYMYMHDKGIL